MVEGPDNVHYLPGCEPAEEGFVSELVGRAVIEWHSASGGKVDVHLRVPTELDRDLVVSGVERLLDALHKGAL
jgi:hypothetical protein